MSFFLKLKTSTDNCINGCTLFNDLGKFSYWENKEATDDEKKVLSYLQNNDLIKNKRILHIGVGNSHIAKSIKLFNKLDGITLSGNELDLGKKLNIKNYDVFFQNKYSSNNLLNNELKFYDVIIDVNIKSFSCCDKAFDNLFGLYSKILNSNGILISSKDGMQWSRQVKPVLSFSFRKLFYKRLKEFDGPSSNMLNEDACFKLAQTFNLTLDQNDPNLIIFKKQ